MIAEREIMEELVEQLNSTLMPRLLREKILAYFQPIEVARLLYRKAGLDFESTLADHLEDGFVIARPWLFMMFRAVQLEQGPTWQIAVAIGKLPEIVGSLPFFLPYVTFQRRLDPRSRVLSLERVANLVAKMKR